MPGQDEPNSKRHKHVPLLTIKKDKEDGRFWLNAIKENMATQAGLLRPPHFARVSLQVVYKAYQAENIENKPPA